MNPELPKNPLDEMEQRLTALLLGELSAEETAALHRAMEQDGELAKLFARLHHTVGLVRETVASPGEPASAQAAPAKLSAARREKLLAHFKTITPKEFTPEKPRRKFTPVELAAAIAILGVIAAMLFPTGANFKSKGSVASAVDNAPARLAENTALEQAKADLTSQLERAPADLAFTVTNYSSFASGGAAGGSDALTLGGKTELGQAFYRIAPDSGGGGGGGGAGALPVTVTDSLGARVRAPDTASLLSEDIPVQYASSADIASALQSVADAAAKRPSAITPLPARPSAAIVLPAPAENADYSRAGGRSSDRVESLAQKTLGDPEWVGELEKPTGPHPTTSAFLHRYAYTSTPQAEGGETFRYALDLNRNAAVAPATDLPVATPEAGAAQNQGQTRAYEDLNNLAFGPRPPVVLPTTGLSTGELSTGGASSLVTNSTLAGKDALSEQSDTTLSVANRPPLDVLNEGTVTTFSGRRVETPVNGVKTVLGDMPAAEKLLGTEDLDPATRTRLLASATNSASYDRYAYSRQLNQLGPDSGIASTDSLNRTFNNELSRSKSRGAVPESERIVPEPNAYNLDVVGYADVPAQTAISADIASNEAVRRQPSSIVLPGLATSAEARLSLVADDEKKLTSDPLLIAGLGSKEELLAKTVGRELAETPPDSQNNRAYVEKQRELQDLTDVRRLMTRKMNIERIDLSLPKSAQVEIVETAQANSTPSQSTWGKLRSAVSGDVERAATIKLERDKSDIDDLSNGRNYSAYDPYFIQTESETIQSEAVLGKVVEQLKLDEAWAKQKGTGAKLKTNEAIAMLRGRLDVRPRPNTTLMEIRAKSADPKEAAQIANAVAETYTRARRERGQRLVAGGIEELEKQSEIQDKKIHQARVELERLRTELKISDADAGLSAAFIEADVAPIRKPATNAPIPQAEIQTSENNFSTFSLNVSDVSFKLTAASLEKGQMPDSASVRSEEFINAFDYRDPEPAAGASIAFAYERARYPFAHNRDLLRFSLKTAAAGRQAGRPLNIVLLLDNSGSMERADRVQIIREALRVLASQLQPQDKLSVITFSRTARLVADGISGDKAGEVAEAVSGLTPQGGTNLEDAMNLAYQTAARHYLASGINRVVLLTDGAANLGDVEPDSLKQKVEAQRKQGIALDCFGIGWDGFNDDLLEVLSRNGDGRYGFINSPEEAATDFVGQLAGALKVAASDVKVQVEFNPRRATAYRQIGYAKHQLTKEQFRDNTVDAAEIAAQEAGNALYTVEVNPAGVGPLCTVRVRYKVPGTTDYREQAWDVPYTGNALSLEQASPAMRLAASASAFSEWLVASPFAGEVTPDRLLGYLGGVPDVYGADSRPKKLEWMIRQAKSVGGK